MCQKGFISGFIIPTFDCLSNIFPTLKYTLENANNNLKEWQKLIDEGRTMGWSQQKKTESSESKKSISRNIDIKSNIITNVKTNDNIEKKKSKFCKTNNTNIKYNSQKKLNNNNINNDIARQSYKKEVKYTKFFKNNEENKKSNKPKKKEFNTPIKLKISDDFNLLNNNNNTSKFLELSNKKNANIITEVNTKKIANKDVNKKNVNKPKK